MRGQPRHRLAQPGKSPGPRSVHHTPDRISPGVRHLGGRWDIRRSGIAAGPAGSRSAPARIRGRIGPSGSLCHVLGTRGLDRISCGARLFEDGDWDKSRVAFQGVIPRFRKWGELTAPVLSPPRPAEAPRWNRSRSAPRGASARRISELSSGNGTIGRDPADHGAQEM